MEPEPPPTLHTDIHERKTSADVTNSPIRQPQIIPENDDVLRKSRPATVTFIKDENDNLLSARGASSTYTESIRGQQSPLAKQQQQQQQQHQKQSMSNNDLSQSNKHHTSNNNSNNNSARNLSQTLANILNSDPAGRNLQNTPLENDLPVVNKIADLAGKQHLRVCHPTATCQTIPTETKRMEPSPNNKLFSSRKKFEKLAAATKESNNAREEYLGTHIKPYLSPYEQEREEYVKSKEKFVGGSFRRHFGKASALPLREEGCIRPHGPYAGQVFFDCPEQNANDWFLTRRIEEKARQMVGLKTKPWYPTTF